ncbi:HAMP domain-containing sensor histidine kinase [Sphingobacterium faecium]|uniref:sensor histidine kinase n=1 Tax=Sphingobacterium faecium TaxID=34087 RepID=UPI00320A2EF1
MILRHNPRFYKWVLCCSFFMLCLLIGFLVFNTYQYKDKNFQNIQKQKIEKSYGQYVMNDKLFPGGNKLFQQFLEPQLSSLYRTLANNPKALQQEQQQVLSSFLGELRRYQNMDMVFNEILAKHHLDTTLSYKLVFDRLDLLLPNGHDWKTFFLKDDGKINTEIAGNLKDINNNNKILQLSVSVASHVAYRFTYSLYVDYPDRMTRVLMDMLPVLCFSILCILLIITINYLTYQNWIDQRKETELKTEFLNHIRHEFNTPITTILICAETLKEQKAILNTAEIGSLGNVIERQADRLKTYFKQILESVSLPKQKPDLKQEDICSLTKEFLKDISLRHSGKIEVSYTPLSLSKKIWIDSSLYFSILDNLVNNALKFNQSASPKVSFYWEETKNELILNIEDNGVGIHQEELKHIFEKFYRSKSSGKKPGLGLGLYYVKTIIDLLDWDLKVESKIGKGSRFKLIIIQP